MAMYSRPSSPISVGYDGVRKHASSSSIGSSVSSHTVGSFFTAENAASAFDHDKCHLLQQRQSRDDSVSTTPVTEASCSSESTTAATSPSPSSSDTTASSLHLDSPEVKPHFRAAPQPRASSGAPSDLRASDYAEHSILPLAIEWGANFWCVVTDPFSPANTFFANPHTGECRWTLPVGSIVLPPNDRGEWWEVMDERTGREYYFHTRTEETRWTRPDHWEGIIIPMVAIQKSTHVTARDSIVQATSSLMRPTNLNLDRRVSFTREEDQDVVISTPLRPRTKSLPKNAHRAARRKASNLQSNQHHKQLPSIRVQRSQASLNKRPGTAESLTQQASRSILMRDQKILEHARQNSGPPFRPDPAIPSLPTILTGRQQRRPKFSITKRPAWKMPQFCAGTAHESLVADSAEAGEISEADRAPPASIRRLGKGLAFDPFESPPDPPRKSLNFVRSVPSLSARSKSKQRHAGTGMVEFPRDLAKALIGNCFVSDHQSAATASIDGCHVWDEDDAVLVGDVRTTERRKAKRSFFFFTRHRRSEGVEPRAQASLAGSL